MGILVARRLRDRLRMASRTRTGIDRALHLALAQLREASTKSSNAASFHFSANIDLDPREREVLRARHDVSRDMPRSFAAVAKLAGLSPERTNQLHERALVKLAILDRLRASGRAVTGRAVQDLEEFGYVRPYWRAVEPVPTSVGRESSPRATLESAQQARLTLTAEKAQRSKS